MAFLPADLLTRLHRTREVGRIPHAMLITGAPGSGRSALAMEIAALVNNISPEKASSHPDIHKLEPESKSRRILVEQFRDFCAPFFATPFVQGATKTGIILDADRLHITAANAFLKTLEEPPPNSLFILITTNPDLLPITIVSRCAHFPLLSAKLPPLEGAAEEVAQATTDALSAPSNSRISAALRLARRLQSLLRRAREEVEAEASTEFKAEKKRLGDTAEEDWIKSEEARIKALTEARVLAIRQNLIAVIAERTADILRARHGVTTLQFPSLAEETHRLAETKDDAFLLRVLDGTTRLRLLLDRNIKEDIALEAGCLSIART